MTEDKADKALRKVIINFTNKPDAVVCSEDELIKIDVSDQVPEDFHLSHITVDRGGNNRQSIDFIERDWLQAIKHDIDTVLDATIVNAKQRESVGRLVHQAIYRNHGHWAM